MATKLYDLAVKTGEYQNSQGETKGRWQNVGAVMQNTDGGKFIMLERWFNPAGIANPDNRSSLLLSMFAPQDSNNQAAPAAKPAPAKADNFDDDIPF